MVQITKNTFGNGCVVIWAVMESGCDLLKKFGILPTEVSSTTRSAL